MIDFTKSNLFDRERAKFRKFIDTKLFTPDEYASRVEISDETMNNVEVIDTASFLGGNPIDFLGGDGESFENMWGGDEDSESERKRHVDISNERMHETGVWWKDILFAPFFLIVYVFKSLIYDFPTKDEWKSIAIGVQKVSAVASVTSAILWILGFKFIFTLSFQAIAAGLMFGLATSCIKYLEKGEEETETDGDGEDSDFGSDLFGGGDSDMDFSALGTNDEALDLDGANLTLKPSNTGFDIDSLFASPNADVIEERVDTGRYKILASSPIEIDSRESFERTLMDVFIQNERYRGVEIHDRKELIESLHGYIVTNDKNFGSWSVAQPRSTEYNNVAYALFKGLGQIQNSFLTDEEVMVVLEIKSNPLLYKIEVELPNYFKLSQVQSRISEIENALRKGESDTMVQVFVSYYQGIFVFKFLRLDNQNLISLGDILRFYDEEKGETALEAYVDPKMGLPILIGLLNNEYPYVVDLEDNTSGAIIGGSGSGKSWFTFLVLFNFILTNDFRNINFVVFDKKNAAFWNQFAKFPHVFGYHTDHEQYLEQFRELYGELDRRKRLLIELNEENIKGYRERLREDGEYEKLKEVPNLIIIVDEITSTMQDIESMYLDRDEIHLYKEFRNILAKITQEGRSLGVRLIVIGQRAIDSSVPKNVLANSSFKFAMKMDVDSDFEIMLGKEVSSMAKPQSIGLGIVKTMGDGLQPLKTLTVGGANEYQVLRLIRVLALEWVRRADGQDILNMPESLNLPKCYNRNKFVQESLRELEEWRILSPSEVTPYTKSNLGGMGGTNMFSMPNPAVPSTSESVVPEESVFAFDFEEEDAEHDRTVVEEDTPLFDFGDTHQGVSPENTRFNFDFNEELQGDTKEPNRLENESVFNFDFGDVMADATSTNTPNEEDIAPEESYFDFDFGSVSEDSAEPLDNATAIENFNRDITETYEEEVEDGIEEVPIPQPTLTKAEELNIKLRIYGHILQNGEKVLSEEGQTELRITESELLARFTPEHLTISKTHSHIRQEGNHFYAWRTTK